MPFRSIQNMYHYIYNTMFVFRLSFKRKWCCYITQINSLNQTNSQNLLTFWVQWCFLNQVDLLNLASSQKLATFHKQITFLIRHCFRYQVTLLNHIYFQTQKRLKFILIHQYFLWALLFWKTMIETKVKLFLKNWMDFAEINIFKPLMILILNQPIITK